jgi:TrmH family RNA methyltransferase
MATTAAIESRTNPRLKHLKRVRDGKIDDEIFIEGVRLAEEATRSPVTVTACFVTDRALEQPRISSLVARLDGTVEVVRLTDAALAHVADTDTPQGIILLARRPKTGKTGFLQAARERKSNTGHFVYLYEVRNPSNLGGILRSAEAAGIAGVIVSTRSADAFSPKSLRASMGSSFRLPIWEDAEFDEVAAWAASKKITVTPVAANGRSNYVNVDWAVPRLLMFGSEADGLTQLETLLADADSIMIGMDDQVESLNHSVWAAIIFFEARRAVSG